jgi:hypothetical protein
MDQQPRQPVMDGVNIDASIAAIQREIDQRVGMIMMLNDLKAKGYVIIPGSAAVALLPAHDGPAGNHAHEPAAAGPA